MTESKPKFNCAKCRGKGVVLARDTSGQHKLFRCYCEAGKRFSGASFINADSQCGSIDAKKNVS